MNAQELSISFSDKTFTIRTSTGWSLSNCNTGFITDRGRLFTTDAQSKDFSVEHCFHVKRLSESSIEFWMSAKNVSDSLLEIKKIIMFDGNMELTGQAWNAMHGEFFKKEEY